MKLIRLRAKGFLGLTEADLDLSRPTNLIHGLNGAGKTSLLDATRWCLYGRCRGTDAAGRGAAVLIQGGAESAAVCLTLRSPDGADYELLRTQRGAVQSLRLTCPDGAAVKGEAAQARIDAVFGAAELGEVCLDGPSFLALDSRAQGALLAGAIGIRLDRETLLREMEASGISAAAQARIDGALLGASGYGEGVAIVGPEQLREVHAAAFAIRRDQNKRVKDLTEDLKRLPTGPPPTTEAIEAAKAAVVNLSGRLAAGQEKLGTLKEQQRHWTTADVRRRELERQAKELEERATQPPALPLGPPVAELEAQIGIALTACLERREAKDAAISARQACATEEEQIRGQMASLQSGEGICDGVFRPERLACPVMAQRAEKSAAELTRLRKQLSKTQAAFGAAQAAEGSARKAWQDAEAELSRIEGALKAARDLAARTQGANSATWDAIQAELDRISEQAAVNPASEIVRLEQQVRELAEQRSDAAERVARLEEALRSADTRAAAEQKLADGSAEAAVLDEVVKALDPKALPARILEARVGKAEKGLNELLGQITGGAYQIAIEAGDGGVALLVRKAGAAHALPTKMLSPSEQLRVGAAIAMSFALLTPFRCVWIDGSDVLLEDLRALLWDTLTGLAGLLETGVMGCSTRTPCMQTDEETGSFWAEGGSVRMIEASQTAEVAV